MHATPEKRKPTSAKVGSLENENAGSNFNSDNATNPYRLQAVRLHVRFGLSWPVARLVAELHFGRAMA
jgi:hypothetical protein